ncbi:MAG: hypothetical protein IJZ70_00185 [Bacteroidales bacterium]|nr:hypothetical protein [Bacteroidales bacterium]
MKLYELLSRVTFDDLVPTLNSLIIKENQLPYFKMAFDELRMMAPTINDDDIDVEMAESYIYVDGCQDNWANVLGKNIIFDDDLQITLQVLAAHVLWDITFFGFSEEEMKASIGQDYGDESHTPDNIYRRKIQNIEDRQWKNYSRGAQWENVNGRRVISCMIAREAFRRQEKRNRAKRMRDARQERQMARLRKLAVREEGICKAVATGCMSREQVEYIMNVQYGDEHTYSSRTNTSEDRAQYIIELIYKYSDIDFSKYDSITAIATSSPGYPFSEEEKTLLQDCFSSKQRFKRMQIVFGSDPSVNSHQMTLLMIVSKD